MDRKLRSRTAGLLKFQHKLCNLQDESLADSQSTEHIYLVESHIQFLPKSITDFLDTPHTSDGLLSTSDSTFDSNVPLLRAYLMLIWFSLWPWNLNQPRDKDYWRPLHSAVTFARKAELAEEQDQTNLVNQVDFATIELTKKRLNLGKCHWSELDLDYRHRTREHHDNFLSFGMQSCLFHYTRVAF